MRYKLLSPDGLEIGFITDSPEFRWELDENYDGRLKLEEFITDTEYTMVQAGGEMQLQDVTPPEEDVPVDDTGRVIRLATALPKHFAIQVRRDEGSDNKHIAEDLTYIAEKGRRYIDDPSEAPEDVQVEEGPKGGLYYDTEGTSTQETAPDDTTGIFDGVEFTDVTRIEEEEGDVVLLSDAEREKVKDAIRDVSPEGADSLFHLTEEWKVESYSAAGKLREKCFVEAVEGTNGSLRNDGITSRDPTAEEVAATKAIVDASQRFIRENYGENVQISRGVGEEAYKDLLTGTAEYIVGNTDDISFSENSVANYSTRGSVAQEFSEKYGTAKVDVDVSYDTILAANDAFFESRKGAEGEVNVKGDIATNIDPSNITFSNGASLPQLRDDIVSPFVARGRVRNSFSGFTRELADAVVTSEIDNKEKVLGELREKVSKSPMRDEVDRRGENIIERGISNIDLAMDDLNND